MSMNKQLNAQAVVAQLRDGMTIGIGGWGPRRKPMALIREILRSDLKDLTIVSYGGPDVGMLCAAGKVKKLVYAFVSLDAIPLEPYFRKARESGQLQVSEFDEGMLQWGLRAAGMRMPFLPTRVGLATDVVTRNPELKMIRSPYEDGENLLAMPAIRLDAALLHVDVSDYLGNTQIHGPDPFFDDLFARAAERCYVSCERLVERIDQAEDGNPKFNTFERYLVNGVVHAPGGAHPTSCAPSYGWDMDHLKRYVSSATEEGGWARYMGDFVVGTEENYQHRIGGAGRLAALPLPIF
jgi:glutaconate CoA-transferase subunit A